MTLQKGEGYPFVTGGSICNVDKISQELSLIFSKHNLKDKFFNLFIFRTKRPAEDTVQKKKKQKTSINSSQETKEETKEDSKEDISIQSENVATPASPVIETKTAEKGEKEKATEAQHAAVTNYM